MAIVRHSAWTVHEIGAVLLELQFGSYSCSLQTANVGPPLRLLKIVESLLQKRITHYFSTAACYVVSLCRSISVSSGYEKHDSTLSFWLAVGI